MRTLALALTAGLATLVGIAFIFSATASEQTQSESAEPSHLDTAIFAGGCFWCSESDFEKLDGVVSVVSGFTGGSDKDPTYNQVAAGRTSHTEGVEVEYDPIKISYAELVEFFWRTIDPTQVDGQFCDKGKQYRTGIFYSGAEQQKIAEESLAKLNQNKPFDAPIVTEITASTGFYPAEEYHQDFYKHNSRRYKFYRWSCGRDSRIEELWGKAHS